jgi:phosphomannomutase
MTKIWQAWLSDMLMGEGATREEAIEEAVAEYEKSIGYGDEPHVFGSRDALVAALAVAVKED